jgi:hypothetical protein
VWPRHTRAVLTVFTVPQHITPYCTELRRWSWLEQTQIVQDGDHSTVQVWCNLALWLQYRPRTTICFACSWMKHWLLTRDQVLRPTLSFHASHCWALPPSWCSPDPASGLFREALCGVSGVNAWEEYTGGGNGRFWGEEAFLKPYLHW